MLLVYVDRNFNQTKLALDVLESKLSGTISENMSAFRSLNNQMDEMEREVSLRMDYLEKMISKLEVGSL